MKTFISLLLTLVTMSIWWFMLHSLLLAMNADRLLWFLYYVYIPVALINASISSYLTTHKDKK